VRPIKGQDWIPHSAILWVGKRVFPKPTENFCWRDSQDLHLQLMWQRVQSLTIVAILNWDLALDSTVAYSCCHLGSLTYLVRRSEARSGDIINCIGLKWFYWVFEERDCLAQVWFLRQSRFARGVPEKDSEVCKQGWDHWEIDLWVSYLQRSRQAVQTSKRKTQGVKGLTKDPKWGKWTEQKLKNHPNYLRNEA
jgi:hypothetical protein